MICSSCGTEFEPAPSDERLMVMGKLERLCSKCERPAPVPTVRPRTVVSKQRNQHSFLSRVLLFDAKGAVTKWIGLMPKYPQILDPDRKGSRGHLGLLHATVIESTPRRMATEPTLTLSTNLTWFKDRGQNLRFWKTPAFWDAMTGGAEIEVPRSDVKDIQDDGGLEITIQLASGGCLRLEYRNT